LKLIDEIYLRFFYRDRQIRLLLKKLENEVSLEINIIIDEANIILDEISKLIDANSKIAKTFSELKTIDNDIKRKIVLLDNDFYRFSENIDFFIKFLKRFIIQTKEKRRQNRLFLKTANQIINEDDKNLNYFLLENIEELYNLEYSKFKKIRFIIEDNNRLLKKALKGLNLIKPKKTKKSITIKEIQPQKLNIIDIEEILKLLNKNTPKDLFEFLINLNEIKERNEAFKIYLHLLSYSNIIYENKFNKYGIRIVKWEKANEKYKS